jgi:CheY-like chemotaxis protein/HPt (histidine-containing phosphotransfer) domain-containing protein
MWLTIIVRDTGIGMRSDDISQLFTDYFRIDVQDSPGVEGTGLGLPITKKIIELMDGTIDVESERGKGSVFTVTFRQGYVDDAVIGPEMIENLQHCRSVIRSQYAKDTRKARTKLPYAHVLVVDDNLVNLHVAQSIMKLYEMRIDCVTSGKQAVDAVREEKVKYNAIFMDHAMPGMDGIQATKIIRSIDTDYAKTIPIIALTANAVVGNEEMFLSNGFQAFLPKPFDDAHLDAVLQRWVRDEEQEKLLAAQPAGQQSQDIPDGQHPDSGGDRKNNIDRRRADRNVVRLDIQEGIKRFGNPNSYNDILRVFVMHTRPFLKTLANVNENNLADYAVLVHGIKGASRGIYAESVAAQATILEDAAGTGNLELISIHNPDFLVSLSALITDIENYLAKTNAEQLEG